MSITSSGALKRKSNELGQMKNVLDKAGSILRSGVTDTEVDQNIDNPYGN